jgi:hypothetical protein
MSIVFKAIVFTRAIMDCAAEPGERPRRSGRRP